MELVESTTNAFRNLEPAATSWKPGANLVVGANGEGKSNLLESVAVLGTLRSFRVAGVRRLVRHGASAFALEGELREGSGSVHLRQEVEVGPPVRRRLYVNGAEVGVAAYLAVFPIYALSGADRDLVNGPPGERRSFLDRFSFLLDPTHLERLRVYGRLLAQRNAALGRGVGDLELDAWDERLGTAAAAVIRQRTTALAPLRTAFDATTRCLRGPSFPDVSLAYRGESWLDPEEEPDRMAECYRSRYTETRARDRLTGYTGEGPHRHDLTVRVDGKPGRDVLSSGQTKVVAAALRLAAVAEVEAQRGEVLPLIVDDMDAELDIATLTRLLECVGRRRQLLLSSAHEGMVQEVVAARATFHMEGGRCSAAEPAGDHP